MTLHTGRLTTLLTAALMFISLSSCSDKVDSPACPEGMGKVSVFLHSDIIIKSPEDDPDVLDECYDYNFRFIGQNGYASSEPKKYGDFIDKSIYWYFGTYRLYAESCTRDEAELGYGRLRYEGLGDPFSVINGQNTYTSVICQVANFQVNVYFDDSMYEAFDAFQLMVQAVSAPPAEDESEENAGQFVPQQYRRLIFDPIEQSGYYNLQSEPILLHYTLNVRHIDAEVFVESGVEGYFIAKEETEPYLVEAGDVITFRVKYNGDTVQSDGVKFIVDGIRTTMNTSLGLPGYNVDDNVKEDE